MYPPIIPLTSYPGYFVTSSGQILHIVGQQLVPVAFHRVGNSAFDYLHLQHDGKLYHRAADRLILTTYAGAHDTYHYVRHKDGDIHNNAVDNLAWAPHKICQSCTAYGEYCHGYSNCKILRDAKYSRMAEKPLSPSKQKLQDRMAAIALKAQALDDDTIKPSLLELIHELGTGKSPNDVHEAMLSKGKTFTIQYVHKVMRMLESDDPRLYKKKRQT